MTDRSHRRSLTVRSSSAALVVVSPWLSTSKEIRRTEAEWSRLTLGKPHRHDARSDGHRDGGVVAEPAAPPTRVRPTDGWPWGSRFGGNTRRVLGDVRRERPMPPHGRAPRSTRPSYSSDGVIFYWSVSGPRGLDMDDVAVSRWLPGPGRVALEEDPQGGQGNEEIRLERVLGTRDPLAGRSPLGEWVKERRDATVSDHARKQTLAASPHPRTSTTHTRDGDRQGGGQENGEPLAGPPQVCQPRSLPPPLYWVGYVRQARAGSDSEYPSGHWDYVGEF